MCVITKFMDGRNWFWKEGTGWTKYRHQATRYPCVEREMEKSEARALADELYAELEWDG